MNTNSVVFNKYKSIAQIPPVSTALYIVCSSSFPVFEVSSSSATESDADFEAMVADYQGAFHSVPVHPDERRFGVARAYDDRFLVFQHNELR